MNIIENIKEEIIKRSNEFQERTKGTKEEYNLYESHVKYVYNYVKELIKNEDVDKESLLIAALLHDVSMTNIKLDRQNHAVYGVNIAGKILNQYNYPQDKIEFIKKIILNHSSKRKNKRTTKEENILVDADCLAHFDSIDSLYSLAHNVMGLNEEDSINFVKNKLTKDYSEVSNKAKKLVEEKYKKIMTSKNALELLKYQNLQYENEQFEIYASNSLKEISKDMAITSSERVSDIFEFFDIKSFRKVQVNLFDNKEEFRKFIATIRGIEENKIPEYCTGTYDKGMINCFIDLKLLENDIYYKKRTYTLAHEFIHIIYLEFILNNDFYKRVTWLDEGVAQYLSGEMKDLDFDRYYNDIIDNLKEVPNLNNLNHGKSFVNDKYNGYALAYITVKYLSETTDLLEVLKSYNKSLEVGESALKEALEYYKNKKVINTK